MTTFLHREGRHLIDGAGQEVLLQGVAVGNWWLPEGYMWRFGDAVASPREIEALGVSLLGESAAAEFWDRYRRTYIGASDVAAMARAGFDSVRLPLNARYFMDEAGEFNAANFAIVDEFIAACRTHGLYVFIDLHGAPGGQTGTNIDDSPNRYPELFTSLAHQDATVRLWCEIARRYADDPVIGGYDLLNEPLPRGFQYRYPDELVALYKRLIRQIRAIDQHHLIILEGSNWARNWQIFDSLWDDNVMLQFHKYWNAPDREHVEEYLRKREELDVPIWMGEGGENNLAWYQGSFQLYEDLDIGWNFWTWKRLAKKNAPVTIMEPRGWQDIVDFAYGGPKPTRAEAARIFGELADNLPFERCEYRANVVNALFRRVPVRLEAELFGFRGRGVSYCVQREGTHFPGFRVSDDVPIVYLRTRLVPPGITEANFHHNLGQARAPEEELAIILSAGDWVRYEFSCSRPEAVVVRLKAEALDVRPACLSVLIDDTPIGEVTCDPVPLGALTCALGEGRHHLSLRCLAGRAVIDAIILDRADAPA